MIALDDMAEPLAARRRQAGRGAREGRNQLCLDHPVVQYHHQHGAAAGQDLPLMAPVHEHIEQCAIAAGFGERGNASREELRVLRLVHLAR